MSLLHPSSKIAPVPELELFAVPPTQTAILGDSVTQHRPITALGNDANPIIGMELKTVNGKNIFTITLDNNTRIEGAPNIAPMASFENALSKLPKKVA